MRIPKRPPSWHTLLKTFTPETMASVFQHRDTSPSYRHWDKLRFCPAPEQLTSEQWWVSVKLQRQFTRRTLPLVDKNGTAFSHTSPLWLQEQLHRVDKQAGGIITAASPDGLGTQDEQQRYLIRSLMEEAITSSQLEGAATTRVVAKDMIRTERPPRDTSEKMILNNYYAMERIQELKREPLSPEILLELQKILTIDTLENPEHVGRFRISGEDAEVRDMQNEVLHTGIQSELIEEEIAKLCAFANESDSENGFVHPVVRAIILHFWLAWLHPFGDGNGRTARAIFYWSVLRSNYWLFQYISISEVIRKAPIQYGRAFLYTETDENDTTYFILYHMKIIMKALKKFFLYAEETRKRIQVVEHSLRSSALGLNYRQLALLSHAIRHADGAYTFKSHAQSQGVSIPTARDDLNDLVERGMLTMRVLRRKHVYSPASNLGSQLKWLNDT